MRKPERSERLNMLRNLIEHVERIKMLVHLTLEEYDKMFPDFKYLRYKTTDEDIISFSEAAYDRLIKEDKRQFTAYMKCMEENVNDIEELRSGLQMLFEIFLEENDEYHRKLSMRG